MFASRIVIGDGCNLHCFKAKRVLLHPDKRKVKSGEIYSSPEYTNTRETRAKTCTYTYFINRKKVGRAANETGKIAKGEPSLIQQMRIYSDLIRDCLFGVPATKPICAVISLFKYTKVDVISFRSAFHLVRSKYEYGLRQIKSNRVFDDEF